MSVQQKQATQQPQTKAQKAKAQKRVTSAHDINFSTIDDLFLSTKGRKLRNMQKKLEAVVEAEKQMKDASFKPDKAFQQKIASRPQLEEAIQDLYEQVELYIRSNPNYAKAGASGISDQDLSTHIEGSLALVGQALSIHALQKQDSSFVEIDAAQTASLGALVQAFEKMVEDAKDGVASLKDSSVRDQFVSQFARLATADAEKVCPDGVSYADLRSFVQGSHEEENRSKTLQLIADKALAEEREKQAEKERAQRAERQAREAEEKRAAEAARKLAEEKAAKEAAAEAERQEAARKEAEAVKAEADEKDRAQKETEVQQETVEESKDTAKQDQENDGQEDQTERIDDGQRGDRQRGRADRGGRGGRGRGGHDGENWRGGGRDGDRRGRGGYRGRGGQRGPVEDDDGFVVQQDAKKQTARRGGAFRGDRGGEYRGRGGDRPRGEWRGDRRGRGEGRGSFRGDRGGQGRPQTEGATQAQTQATPNDWNFLDANKAGGQ